MTDYDDTLNDPNDCEGNKMSDDLLVKNVGNETEYVTCPFCGEKDFDLIGLKTHFLNGWCDVYESTDCTRRIYGSR